MAPPRIQPNLGMLRRFLGHVRSSWTSDVLGSGPGSPLILVQKSIPVSLSCAQSYRSP